MNGDQSVESARRAFAHFWPDQGDFEFEQSVSGRQWAVRAAWEAHLPIRQLHQPMELKQSVFNGEGTFIGQRVSAVVCGHCYGRPQVSGHCDDCDSDVCEGTVGPYLAHTWPCATARLVYSAEELS